MCDCDVTDVRVNNDLIANMLLEDELERKIEVCLAKDGESEEVESLRSLLAKVKGEIEFIEEAGLDWIDVSPDSHDYLQ